MILNKKLELKLEVMGVKLRADLYGSFFHIKNISDQKLYWEDELDIQEFYVFPSEGIDDELHYDYHGDFIENDWLSIHEDCKQVKCLYDNTDDFDNDIKNLIKSYCEENKIPYEFMDHYFDGNTIDLCAVEELLYENKNEGICNEEDKYKRFKWKYDVETGIVKIYDNIIIPDMEQNVKTKGDIIKFFNRFADLWNNEIIGKYER